MSAMLCFIRAGSWNHAFNSPRTRRYCTPFKVRPIPLGFPNHDEANDSKAPLLAGSGGRSYLTRPGCSPAAARNQAPMALATAAAEPSNPALLGEDAHPCLCDARRRGGADQEAP